MEEGFKTLLWPRLDGGMLRDAPRHTTGPGTHPVLYYDMQNMHAYKGRLQRRGGFDDSFTTGLTKLGTAEAEYPILIADVAISPGLSRQVVVTNLDIYVEGLCVTPRYATGQVTVTNASPNVTGVGTAWITRRIGQGHRILIEGTWYTILSVATDTALTLTTNFSGTSSPPDQNYSIRRAFSMSHLVPFAALRVIEGDGWLVANNAAHYNNPSTMLNTSNTGALFKIAGLADAGQTITAASVTVAMSTDQVEAGTDAIGEWFQPFGLETMEDGRLVMPAHASSLVTASPAYYVTNRVFYSSHLDPAIWSTEPGGFTNIAVKRGGITGGRRMGSAMIVYLQDGITIGTPTGADDPPLNFQPTRAHIGAAGPRVIASVPTGANSPEGHFFLAPDLHTYVFNGASITAVETGWDQVLRVGTDGLTDEMAFGRTFIGFDEHRQEVGYFYDTGATRSIELTYCFKDGASGRHLYKNVISAVSEQGVLGLPGNNLFGEWHRWVGVRGTNSSGTGTEFIYLQQFRELNDTDLPVISAGLTPGGMYVESHDFNPELMRTSDPANALAMCRILRITIWFVGRAATTETLQCGVSNDSGTTYETDTESNVLTDVPNERFCQFFFETSAPADKWRIKISSSGTDTFSYALTRMCIDYVVVGDGRVTP